MFNLYIFVVRKLSPCHVENDPAASCYAQEYLVEDLAVRASKFGGAGNGLFCTKPLAQGVHLGYFGGMKKCSMCIKRYKIHVGASAFTSVDCRVVTNTEGEDVRWYLCRTRVEINDGLCWYINSCKKLKERDCIIIFEGYDAYEHPVVRVVTTRPIEVGEQLLLDYMARR